MGVLVEQSDLRADAPPHAVDPEIFLDLLDRLPQAVAILDGEGRVRFWSAGAAALFGYTREEMIGRDAVCLLPASRATSGEAQRLRTHALEGNDLRDFETE